ncbi:MAG TPA: Fe-S cluster assembly protein IscX [Thermoleophilia bacterium]
MSLGVEVLERVEGRSGELVLRRSGADLEVILNGAFLISSANDASSRAMVTAAMPYLAGGALEVLIGGLGLGYALDEALADERVARVTVAEYEPTIMNWFRAYGVGLAERAAAGERAGRAVIEVADVADVLSAHPEGFDLVAVDTDNGPDWLVREANAGLYSEAGLRLTQCALRPGGAAVFWSPERYAGFERSLAGVFARVLPVAAFDVVQSRRHEYTMYVCPRDHRPRGVHSVEEGGGMGLTWAEPREIAWALLDAHPDTDPLDLNFVDLHRMIVALPAFDADPDDANETRLEAVVVAWHDQR